MYLDNKFSYWNYLKHLAIFTGILIFVLLLLGFNKSKRSENELRQALERNSRDYFALSEKAERLKSVVTRLEPARLQEVPSALKKDPDIDDTGKLVQVFSLKEKLFIGIVYFPHFPVVVLFFGLEEAPALGSEVRVRSYSLHFPDGERLTVLYEGFTP